MARTSPRGVGWLPLCAAALLAARGATAMGEEERVAEYERRGHTWPPEWTPATPGWRALMERREQQIYAIESSQERWDAWTTLVTQGVLVGNFTARGFEVALSSSSCCSPSLLLLLPPPPHSRRDRRAPPPSRTQVVRAPDWAQKMLLAQLHALNPLGADGEDTPERQIDVIGGAQRPLFVPLSAAQKDEILWGLKEMHERWSGVELEPVIAYGLRVYVGFIVFEEVCRG